MLNNSNKTGDISMFNASNKYGYKLNLNHPKIRELYYRFKEYKGIAKHIPLSNDERFEFENYILRDNPPGDG